ncbi:MAG: recombinase family protein [Bryobacteraceae bacterium]
MATGPMGPLSDGSADNIARTGPSRSRLRVFDRALDLTTPAGRAIAGLLAIFAEFEREILRERTRAGLAHARQNGKRLGRPATAALHTAEIRTLHRAGFSKSEIARRLRIGRTSVRRILGATS